MAKALRSVFLLLALALLAGVPAVASVKTESSGGAPMIMAQQAAPSVSLAAAANLQVRLNSPVPVTATFSEPVSGFTIADITVMNGAASNLAASDRGDVYTFDVTPNTLGEVTVDIAAGVATDAQGIANTAAMRLSLGIPYDFDGNGGISISEVFAAIDDYFAGKITIAQTIAAIQLYFATPTEPDRAALVAFYNATGGPNWTNNSGWLTDAPVGQWHGVSTNDSGRVTTLGLADERQLSGELPAELGNLTALYEPVPYGTIQLTGTIPASRRQPDRSLESLYLYAQPAERWEIPDELGDLLKLIFFLSLWHYLSTGCLARYQRIWEV